MGLIIKRDPKDLYWNAQKSLIKNFTGIGSSYKIPKNPEIVIDTEKLSVKELIDQIKKYLGNFAIMSRIFLTGEMCYRKGIRQVSNSNL